MKNYSLRARHLYKFLYKKNLIRKFLKNLTLQHPCSHGVPQYLDDNDLLKLLETVKNIDYAFTWSQTKEGHGYWSRLNLQETNEYNIIYKDIYFVRLVKKN